MTLTLTLSLSLFMHHCVVYIILTYNEPVRSVSHVNMVLIKFGFCKRLRGTRHVGNVAISTGPSRLTHI